MSAYTPTSVETIPTSRLEPHPDNPRKDIGDVTELAASIKANGLLSPISVVPHHGNYRVIAGHRRLAAARQAGINELPCFVLDLTARQQLEAMINENTQRQQLTVIEEADAIQGLLDLGATIAETAGQLGRSETYIRSRARIARIPDTARRSNDRFAQLDLAQLQAIAEFDGHPELQSDLARHAGGNDFDYRLDRTRQQLRQQEWKSAALREIERLNLPMLDEDLIDREHPWEAPEGWEQADMFYASHAWNESRDRPFADQWREYAERHDTAGLRLAVFDSNIHVYRKAKAGASEGERRLDAERAREREQALENRRYADGLRHLREQWLADNLFHLPGGTLMGAVIRLHRLLMLADNGYMRAFNGLDTNGRDKAIDSYNRIRANNPLPVTEKNTKEGVYHLDTNDNLAELARRCEDSKAELIAIDCAWIEATITPEQWLEPATTLARGYYECLTRLGYQPSSEEQAALDHGRQPQEA